jgi:hypothetical protein
VVYVAAYEASAVTVCSGGFVAFSNASLQMAGALSEATSVIAALWNFIFNALFEAWESRQVQRWRGWQRRVVHAVAFFLMLCAEVRVPYLHILSPPMAGGKLTERPRGLILAPCIMSIFSPSGSSYCVMKMGQGRYICKNIRA